MKFEPCETCGGAGHIVGLICGSCRIGLDHYRLVEDFHRTYRQPIGSKVGIVAERVQLRLDLIDEERRELTDALKAGDVVEVADALTDLLYVIHGMGIEFGIDLNACFAEVHRSNMSKLDANGKPIFRDDGKVLKGPNYSRPDLAAVLGVRAAARG